MGVVVNGGGHLDEASLTGTTHYALLENGKIDVQRIEPEELGFERISLEAIRGGDAKQNTAILKVFIAGGLTIENVQQAKAVFDPYACVKWCGNQW